MEATVQLDHWHLSCLSDDPARGILAFPPEQQATHQIPDPASHSKEFDPDRQHDQVIASQHIISTFPA